MSILQFPNRLEEVRKQKALQQKDAEYRAHREKMKTPEWFFKACAAAGILVQGDVNPRGAWKERGVWRSKKQYQHVTLKDGSLTIGRATFVVNEEYPNGYNVGHKWYWKPGKYDQEPPINRTDRMIWSFYFFIMTGKRLPPSQLEALLVEADRRKEIDNQDRQQRGVLHKGKGKMLRSFMSELIGREIDDVWL